MWRLWPSRASFRLHFFLPNSSPLTLLFLILRHPSYSFFEWRGRGATGRLGRRFGSRGATTMPGTALGPGGCHPRGQPPRPARPQSPKCHWAAWVGEARSGEARLEGQVFAAVAEADEGRERGRKVIPLWSRPSSDPFVVPGEVGWLSCSELAEVGASVRIGCRPGLAEVSDSPWGLGPNRALPAANGELRYSSGLEGSSPAGGRRSCHSSTSPPNRVILQGQPLTLTRTTKWQLRHIQ